MHLFFPVGGNNNYTSTEYKSLFVNETNILTDTVKV